MKTLSDLEVQAVSGGEEGNTLVAIAFGFFVFGVYAMICRP